MSNMTRVILEPVFVLHSRPYRNSSLIVELLSMRFGRIAAVARSARGPRSRYQGKLQLFAPILASWAGRGELKNLGNIELSGSIYQLEGKALLCGFYLNELLIRLLRHDDPYPKTYQRYQQVLNNLEKNSTFEAELRYFENNLLQDLGYGLSLVEVLPEKFYRYLPGHGFVLVDPSDDRFVFPGYALLALYNESLEAKDELLYAKRLMRMVLARHLGEKPIRSRELL